MGKTPFLATCERCHLKFFTPTQLSRKPVEAEQNLRERFDIHKCRPEDVGPSRVLTFGLALLDSSGLIRPEAEAVLSRILLDGQQRHITVTHSIPQVSG